MKLEERVINCKHWRWMPGMLEETSNLRVTKASTEDDPRVGLGDLNDFLLLHSHSMQGLFPDLTDPATLGCLLVLVRDAYKDAYASAGSLHDENGYWGIRDCDGFVIATGRSEREALVIALEKADAE